ncbi:hypothetical protein [Streptomyces sp. NPDC002588]|uniref:hypothetical protein n=1 Tax=Streptomyces sp. NPDC002588 TaxID=3154419 RepID=UPI00331E2679
MGADEVCWPVRDMAHVPVMSSRPMRGFTWRAKQRHRSGLEALASAGGKHGFESLKEVSLLVALDFLRASEVLSQPFRLDFEHTGGHAWHIPDFLAVIGGGMWLLDVRPMELIKERGRAEVRGGQGSGGCLRLAVLGGRGLATACLERP